MARVTPIEVKAIIETSLTLTSFIQTANVLVNTLLQDESCMTTALLKEIELYLAAHFTAMRERQLSSEKIGDAEDNYLGKAGMKFNFTQYGQQAMLLDCSGKLEQLQSRKLKVSMRVTTLPYQTYNASPRG